MDVKARVYTDFAKMRAQIALLPDGQKKAKALHIWFILAEMLNGLNKPKPQFLGVHHG